MHSRHDAGGGALVCSPDGLKERFDAGMLELVYGRCSTVAATHGAREIREVYEQ